MNGAGYGLRRPNDEHEYNILSLRCRFIYYTHICGVIRARRQHQYHSKLDRHH